MGDAVVVGVTARVIRGSVSGVQAAGRVGDAFERAADAASTGSTTGDVDAGVLVDDDRVTWLHPDVIARAGSPRVELTITKQEAK